MFQLLNPFYVAPAKAGVHFAKNGLSTIVDSRFHGNDDCMVKIFG